MTKAALLLLVLAALAALPAPAQDNSTAIAVNEAVLRQANTIVLRQKLAEARSASLAGETASAAKLYQEACELCQQIGSGIDAETAQAINGLAGNRLALARDAQGRGDLREAATQAQQVLRVDPNNAAALAFKKQNDQMTAALKGQIPSKDAMEQASQVAAQKTDAGTLVQDGRLLYEMGKLDDAEAKLNQALVLNPDNPAALYFLNLIQQARFIRESAIHTVDTQKRMSQVEKQWITPSSKVLDPSRPNPYATNTLVYTGPGRQAIVAKLDHIRLDTVSYDSLPLSEVLRNLSEQSKLRDPERKGINFLVNPNPDLSGQPVAPRATAGGRGALGGPNAPAIDPATGLPAANTETAGGGEPVDVGAFIVKIPNLTDVRLADVLDAIVLVTDHPIKYTVTDFAIVFSAKGAESPQLFTREFRVDPNTFYSGLESVGSASFGSVSSDSNGGNGGGGGGNNSGGGGGGNNNNNSGSAVVGVVNAFSGAGGLRSSGNGQGGGGGGGQNGGAMNPLAAGGGQGGGGNLGGGGGLQYITQISLASTPSAAARSFFNALGLNLDFPKAVFFNDRLGKLFVKATESDLDTIERAIEMLNEVAPQVHIKARFIEVEQDDNRALGFDWYLGQFGHSVVAQGGNPGSLTVPQNSANPIGAFPGATLANTIPDSGQSLFSSGMGSGAGTTTAAITGILTDPNFQVVIHALQTRQGSETLAEPEVTTTSGRQTQMRATSIINVVTGFSFNNGTANNSGGNSTTMSIGSSTPQQPGVASESPETSQVETGPILDVVPYVLTDGYTINMALIPSVTEFTGYETIPAGTIPGYNPGSTIGNLNGTVLPVALPNFTVRQVVTTVNVWDNQTVVLGGLISSTVQSTKQQVPVIGDLPLVGGLFQSSSKTTQKKNLMIFVTATIVDPAGNRVHSDDELPFAQAAVPVQPANVGVTSDTVKQVPPPVVSQ
jgi:type II secretory pathway component GspD/PulD (secretin)/tetratricopeptide (TPR) repeat protein